MNDKHILLVEDDETLQALIEKLLIKNDYIVSKAVNIEDAKKRGAYIIENNQVINISRGDENWSIELENSLTVKSKILINASGPWINDVLNRVIKQNSKKLIRLVKLRKQNSLDFFVQKLPQSEIYI